MKRMISLYHNEDKVIISQRH